jgi:hypothetical protein
MSLQVSVDERLDLMLVELNDYVIILTRDDAIDLMQKIAENIGKMGVAVK